MLFSVHIWIKRGGAKFCTWLYLWFKYSFVQQISAHNHPLQAGVNKVKNIHIHFPPLDWGSVKYMRETVAKHLWEWGQYSPPWMSPISLGMFVLQGGCVAGWWDMI